jgi:hypothetical protein
MESHDALPISETIELLAALLTFFLAIVDRLEKSMSRQMEIGASRRVCPKGLFSRFAPAKYSLPLHPELPGVQSGDFLDFRRGARKGRKIDIPKSDCCATCGIGEQSFGSVCGRPSLRRGIEGDIADKKRRGHLPLLFAMNRELWK